MASSVFNPNSSSNPFSSSQPQSSKNNVTPSATTPSPKTAPQGPQSTMTNVTPKATVSRGSSGGSSRSNPITDTQPAPFEEYKSQAPTYDPITMTYTDSSGLKSSVAPQNVPAGTTTISSTSSAPNYASDTQQKAIIRDDTPQSNTKLYDQPQQYTPRPNTIGLIEKSPYGTSPSNTWAQGLGGSIKNLGRNIAGSFGFGDEPDWKGTFDPLRLSGKEKSEAKIKEINANQGTIIYDTMGNPAPIVSTITLGEKEEKKDIERDFKLKALETVTIKELEGATTEEEQKSIISGYEQKAGKIYKDIPETPGLRDRSGKGVADAIPKIAETGAIIGASTLGGPVGATVSSAYLLGQSEKQFFQGQTFTEKALGLTGMGLSLIGFGSGVRALEKQIITAEVQSASQRLGQQTKFSQVEIISPSGKDGVFGFKATQNIPGWEREITGKGVFVQTDKGLTLVPKGQYSSTMSGEVWDIYAKGKTVFVSSESGKFVGIGASSPKGIMPVSTAIGKGTATFDMPTGMTFDVGKYGTQRLGSASVLAGIDTSTGNLAKYSTTVSLDRVSSFGKSVGVSKEIAKTDTAKLSKITGLSGNSQSAGSFNGNVLSVQAPSSSSVNFIPGGVSSGSTYGTTTTLGSSQKGIIDAISKQSPITPTATSTKVIPNIFNRKQTQTNILSATKPINIEQESLKVTQIPRTETLTDTTQSTITTNIPRTISISGSSHRTTEMTIPITPTPTERVSPTIPVAPRIRPTPRPTTPGIDTSLPFGFPLLPSMKFPSGRTPSANPKSKRGFRYTPSFEAVVFKIKGAKPKGIETGARVRPILTKSKKKKRR